MPDGFRHCPKTAAIFGQEGNPGGWRQLEERAADGEYAPGYPALSGVYNLDCAAMPRIGAEQSCNPLVEGHQLALATYRQIQQERVRDLLVSHDPLLYLRQHSGRRVVQTPELMIPCRNVQPQRPLCVRKR